MRRIAVLVMFLFVIGMDSIVSADEIAELKQQLAEMQQRLEKLEAAQKMQERQIDEKIVEVIDSKKVEALPESLKWAENVKISGDLRYRHETIEEQADGRPDRQRNRVRARLNIKGKVNDEWDIGVRLASGSADPASTNQTLEDSFSSKEMWLDLAYFNWHPDSVQGFDVFGGKMKNPFYKAGKNQLIWDDDVNPEGVAAQYEMPLNDCQKLYLNGGGFWVNESASGVDTSLFGVQAYLKHLFADKSYLVGGVSYFDYGNIKGQGDLKTAWSSSGSFFGNTSAANAFVNDYDLVEAFGEYSFKANGMPVSFYGNYVQNVSADTSGDTGWLIGCKINKAQKVGSWQFNYNYRDLQADAVLGALSDSDFIGGGTDGRGHKFSLKYQLAKNLQTGLTYLLDEVGSSSSSDEENYRRLQADLILKF